MSRSIHQNRSRRYWREHGPHEFEDWGAQFRKSKIKRSVKRSRKSPEEVFALTTPEAIHYSVEKLQSSLFFPATLEDVQGIMAELPLGFLNGVRHVRFLTGREYINSQESIDGEVLDPILHRKSVEIEPGVYAPIVLGAYSQRSGDIQIFAYAHDSCTELTKITELALKLNMLQTLVHELVHNQDRVQRVARGRWLMDDVEKAEAYANKLTRELFDSVVVPYVRSIYGSASLNNSNHMAR